MSLPRDLPATWLQPQLAGAVFRFVDTQFSEETAVRLAVIFSDIADISIEPMTLRSIFLAVAKAGRISASEKEAR